MRVCESVYDPKAPSSLTFKAYLQSEFARRCSQNSLYSLRSFANNLNIDHSTLSQLMRGKRPFTERTIRKLGRRLRLGEGTIEDFVTYESLFALSSSGRVENVRQLMHDTLNLISNPCHLSILELVNLEEFRPDSRWIARVLDVSTDEVNVALNRLMRLGLLEMSSSDCWTDKSGTPQKSLNEFVKATIQHLSERLNELSEESTSESLQVLPGGKRFV